MFNKSLKQNNIEAIFLNGSPKTKSSHSSTQQVLYKQTYLSNKIIYPHIHTSERFCFHNHAARRMQNNKFLTIDGPRLTQLPGCDPYFSLVIKKCITLKDKLCGKLTLFFWLMHQVLQSAHFNNVSGVLTSPSPWPYCSDHLFCCLANNFTVESIISEGGF